MAYIEKRENKDGTTIWKVQIRIAGAPPANESFDSYELAKEFEHDTEKKIRDRLKKYGTANAFAVTDDTFLDTKIKDIVGRYLAIPLDAETIQNNAETAANPADIKKIKRLKSNVEKWGSIAPKTLTCVGTATLRDMKVKWFKNYIKDMRAMKTNIGNQFTYVTIDKQMSLLRRAIASEAEDRDVMPPPFLFSTATMFPKNWARGRNRRLRPGEEALIAARLKRIRSQSSRHWLYLFKLALESGARLQELLFSDFSHFEECGNAIFWIIPAANTKKDTERRVCLNKRARRIFRILKRLADPKSTRVFHHLGSPTSVSCSFKGYVREAGIVNFKFHDCRHESISRMCSGKSEAQIFMLMEMVGHTTTEMFRRYCHPTDEDFVKMMG